MDVKITLTKNWDEVGKLFQFTVPEVLDNSIESAIDEANKIYSESILNVIVEQPGDWTKKSDPWALRSGSSDLFIGKQVQFATAVTDTGSNSRGIRAKQGDKKIFVGARHDVRHHSGYTMEQMAGLLQAIPDGSRDLFARAYERVEDRINRVFRNVGAELR